MATLLQDMYNCPLINEALTDLRSEMKIQGLSGYNTSGVENPVPPGVVNAMIKIFLSEDIGFGATENGEVYTEVMSNEKDMRIAVLYNPAEKKISACQFDVNDVTTKQALTTSSTRELPFYTVIPCLALQRIANKFGELDVAWKEVIDTKGDSYIPKIPDCQGAHCILDSFVTMAPEDFAFELSSLENLALVPETVFDYTPMLMDGAEGTFLLTKAVEKPEDLDPFAKKENKTFSNQMEEMRAEVWPLVKDYHEALSDEDKLLVPNEEKLGIYIPTKKFKNIVKILADGIRNGERDTQNVLLKGPPGVGKSTMAVAIAYVFSMPYRFTQSYKTADASEYIGTTVAENGVLKTNVETQFAQTVMRGGVHMDDDNSATCSHTGL